MINLTIPGEPRGKGRPRFMRSGHTYTDEKTKAYESAVKAAWYKAGRKKISGAVYVHISAYFSVPKSGSKALRADKLNGLALPTKKPDVDNIAKIILDALNGLAFDDDKDVIYLSVVKEYTDGAGEVIVGVGRFEDGNNGQR